MLMLGVYIIYRRSIKPHNAIERAQHKTPTAFYTVGVMRYFQVAVSTCSPVMETVVSAVMVWPL